MSKSEKPCFSDCSSCPVVFCNMIIMESGSKQTNNFAIEGLLGLNTKWGNDNHEGNDKNAHDKEDEDARGNRGVHGHAAAVGKLRF